MVNINFSSGLIPSTHGCDAIFVCVGELSKMTHFLPTMTHVIEETWTLDLQVSYEMQYMVFWGQGWLYPPHFILKPMD